MPRQPGIPSGPPRCDTPWIPARALSEEEQDRWYELLTAKAVRGARQDSWLSDMLYDRDGLSPSRELEPLDRRNHSNGNIYQTFERLADRLRSLGCDIETWTPHRGSPPAHRLRVPRP